MQLKDTPDAFADARIEEKFIQYEKSRDSPENWEPFLLAVFSGFYGSLLPLISKIER